ncbi:hypothetical protein U0038_17550 [Sphingobacterium spiritivorum]|uniref:Uncharacterized protein n=1 Tax=Sphingobacterium spiritivorum ATCC 33861 TaxID=525373 RepID=D7VN50_SPHSI|nr:hypothetical protein [Sphingobacterium spiritivorum]EFK57347.1 hypothetical protein HMPREF0766_12420 [Sphingobacterium spiritivorum ATCC 33861]QQT36573.1 hypothetical protein I6J01_03840 [Sphingobacterium spiritivorum]WQD33324.1 hypothetical protein U0038_17550 [Sphingobacterium spiritivorum]SUJ22088.1 Uncharacterised protein [Sphingobacterium spiritivorum]
MDENKINISNSSKREEYLICVVNKVIAKYPTKKEFDKISNKNLGDIKEMYISCYKDLLIQQKDGESKIIDTKLGWSEINKSAFKRTLLKRLAKEMNSDLSNPDLIKIVDCTTTKVINSYPQGLNFSQIDLSQYHENIKKFVFDCIAIKE